MEAEYEQITEQKLVDQVRAKYRKGIEQLKNLGFAEMGIFSEALPWFGLSHGLFGLFGVIGALLKEITRIGERLSVSIILPVMVSTGENTTYAFPFGLGVNFCTGFTDGTCLVSSNHEGIEIRDEEQKFYKIDKSRSVESAWTDHQNQVRRFQLEGKQVQPGAGFAHYFQLSKRIDDYLYSRQSKIVDWKDTLGPKAIFDTLVAAIIWGSVLVSATFTLLFLADIVHSFYPTCWFLRNVPAGSLPQVVVPLALAWGLAWFQGKPFMAEGIGTRLYGRDPAPADSQGYISTKWLVLVVIPLLPVRSYNVIEQPPDIWNKQQYLMRPLNMNWKQVKETIWESKITYGVLALIVIGFILLDILGCR